jgi:hypothetical protein
MSLPENILENDPYRDTSALFVLAAFSHTDTAENAEIPLDSNLNIGDDVGGGVVIVNDARPTAFQIVDFVYEYNWNSLETVTTLCSGSITVANRSNANFLNFLQEEVVDRLETSLENVSFALRVFWRASTGEGADQTPTVIGTEKLIFSVPDISHTFELNQSYFILSVLPLFNAKGQLSNYANIYNMNITHEDGNLHDEIPTPDPAGGAIKPRGEEDAEKLSPREERIEKSKPMITLGDVADALEIELMERTKDKIHKGQLQEWLAVVRDDFEDKLDKPPIQEKYLPIDYHVEFEDGYDGYLIDNRSLLFEQPEQEQGEPGIRVIPTKTGETIVSLINRIMGLSKQVGTDSIEGKNFKIATPWRRLEGGDIIKYNIIVKQYTKAKNSMDEDTGPGDGESAVSPLSGEGIPGPPSPLTLFFNSNENMDANKLHGKISRNDSLDVTEENPPTADGRVSTGGDREQITAEREKDEEFFGAGFSGHRAFISTSDVLHVEYPIELANKYKSVLPAQSIQDARMTITIKGNPDLYSDLLRNPSDVANVDPGNVNMYQFIEYYPLYCKLVIRYPSGQDQESSEDELGPEKETDADQFYHVNNMHMYRVVNRILSGRFTQTIDLLRSDDLI